MAVPYRVVSARDIKKGFVKGSDNLSQRNWILGKGETEKSFFGVWTHKPGCRLPEKGWKWHDEEEVEYIVQGQMRLLIADRKGKQIASHLLKKGDLFYIAKGVPHAADIVGRETCIGLLFCPKDYQLPTGQPAWSDRTNDPAGWRQLLHKRRVYEKKS
jgi:quercetin dioxygenase-like cupin family protein